MLNVDLGILEWISSLLGKKNVIVDMPEECIKEIRKYVDLGVTYFMLKFLYAENFRSFEIFAENLIPAFKTT